MRGCWLLLAALYASCAGPLEPPVDGGLDASVDAAVGVDASPPDAGTRDAASPDAGPPPVTRIAVVEQASGRVLVLEKDADWAAEDAIVWAWDPATAGGIAADHRGWFGLPDEVKPARVDGADVVLVTASRGGVAMVRVEDGAVLFYAMAGGNPHSVEQLPDGNLVTASSTGGYLRLFSTDPAVTDFPDEVVTRDVPLESAHGVVWDPVAERLWALGHEELVSYRYEGPRDDPHLSVIAMYPLPSGGGHDLYPIPGTRRLLVSTGSHVYTFDIERDAFTPFEPIADWRGVKSVSLNPTSGQLLVMRATESWWSDTLRLLGPDETRTLPGAELYKARWWSPVALGPSP